MKRFGATFIALVMVAFLSIHPLFNTFAAQAAPPPLQHYTVIDLTPAGATAATALGISGTTQVGTANFPVPGDPSLTETHAVIWSGSADQMIDLGIGSALAASDGQQVGSAFGRAVLWSGTPESQINLHPIIAEQSIATGVAGNQQVGWGRWRVACVEKKGACGGGDGTRTVIHPFMWAGSAASAVDITPFDLGFGAGRALGTDGVQQVGYGQQVLGPNVFSGPFAVVWTGTAASAVSLNPPNSSTSEAKGVAGGQQVGYAYSPARAMLWTGTAASAVNLHPAGFSASQANATNGTQQVGFAIQAVAGLAGNNHAMVWSGSVASAVDLHQFLPFGYISSTANAIDAAGNIVGTATTTSGNTRAIMWVPSTGAEIYAQSLALGQVVLRAGASTQATVTLNQPAPAGGATVNVANYITQQGTNPIPFSISVPASVTVPEGQTSASFPVTTSLLSVTGFTRTYLVSIQAGFGDTVQSAVMAVTPPLFLSTLALTFDNIVGGANVTGTVTLNGAAPAEGAQVTLSSNNAAAIVPPSVLVNPGQTFATFTIQTSVVTTFTNVTISATYGIPLPATQTATLALGPEPTDTDTVAIQKADYVVSKGELIVQATSTSQFANLDVYVTATGELIGSLINKGAGSYAGKFIWATNPQNITVVSSLSGRASLAVNAK
ncbi:MAG: hypothetical protein AB1757_02205 [Acidobacteriota bacterium]